MLLFLKDADFPVWLCELLVSTNRKAFERLANQVHIYTLIGKQIALIVLTDGQNKLLPDNTADKSQSFWGDNLDIVFLDTGVVAFCNAQSSLTTHSLASEGFCCQYPT